LFLDYIFLFPVRSIVFWQHFNTAKIHIIFELTANISEKTMKKYGFSTKK